jgi:hypothetical protein
MLNFDAFRIGILRMPALQVRSFNRAQQHQGMRRPPLQRNDHYQIYTALIPFT